MKKYPNGETVTKERIEDEPWYPDYQDMMELSCWNDFGDHVALLSVFEGGFKDVFGRGITLNEHARFERWAKQVHSRKAVKKPSYITLETKDFLMMSCIFAATEHIIPSLLCLALMCVSAKNDKKRVSAAKKAWATMRKQEAAMSKDERKALAAKRSRAARKAWRTMRRQVA